MKQFHFRLERVLNFFRRQELAQSLTVAEVERRVVELHAKRDRLEHQKAEIERAIREGHKNFQREELVGSYAHVDYLARTLTVLDEDIAAAQRHLDIEREQLLQLTKRRRVVEELRTRKRATYDAELARLEIAFLDDVNARRLPAFSLQKEDLI